MGQHETTLSELVASSSKQYIRPLMSDSPTDTKKRGEIILVTEEATGCKQIAQLYFSGENVPRYFFKLLRPTTFLVIYRSNGDGSFSRVYKTPNERNTTTPFWPHFQLRLRTLCNGEYERPLKIECYRYQKSGNHKLIGSVITTFGKLLGKLVLFGCY